MTPSLEIISIASDSLVARQAPVDGHGGGIRAGDRVCGINGELFLEKEEQTIDYFTSIISKLNVPYTIQFEFAPRKVETQKGTSPPSSSSLLMYRTELRVRLVNHVHSVMSTENNLNITAYMSEDSYDVREEIFTCKYTPIVVASPIDACTSVARMTGSNGRLEGAFVVVSRGICAFEAKIEHLKFAGALGAIVINTDDKVFSIPRPPDRGQRSLHEGINIPVIMVTKSDGDKLLQSIIGDVHNTLTAVSHGFEVRGHEIGQSAEGRMVVKELCDEIEMQNNKEHIEAERAHLDRVRHQMAYSRGRMYQEMVRKYSEQVETETKDLSINKAKQKSSTVKEEVVETVVDTNAQFEIEYEKLKALPSSAFKDKRRSNLIYNQLKSTYDFSEDQLQSIYLLIYGDQSSNHRDEL